MDSNPCEKRLRNECSIDRISDLHDSILGKILSYLPTRNAVATSILSTRWKNIFPSWVPLIQLDFVDIHRFRPILHNNSDFLLRNYMDFVDKLLNVTLRDVKFVERVVLIFEGYYGNEYMDDKTVSWVHAALRLNVQRLRFMSKLCDSKALIDSLNGCTTLVELEMGNDFYLCFPKEFMLPKLKRLLLDSLDFGENMDSIDELLRGCPVLNDLRIFGCNADPDTHYIQIRHPILNKLVINGCCADWECTVEIDAPNLETFVYGGSFLSSYVLKNNRSLHSLSIIYEFVGDDYDGDAFHAKAYRLAKLVQSCPGTTTTLSLLGDSVTALSRSSVPLPIFQNLTRLTLGCMETHGWRMLAHFLKSAPNLTILTFEEELDFTWADSGFQSLLPSLPVSLELNIEKIEIWEFEWSPDAIKLIEYFLKNAKVLQELIVHCLLDENMTDIEKLSMLPRHSKACQVLLKHRNNWSKSHGSRYDWSEFS